MDGSTKRSKNSEKPHSKDSIEEFLLDDLLSDDEKTSVGTSSNQIKLDDVEAPPVKTMSFEDNSEFTGLPSGLEPTGMGSSNDDATRVIPNSEATVQIQQQPNQFHSTQTEKSEENAPSSSTTVNSNDATIAVSGIQQISRFSPSQEQKPKITLGQHKGVKISGGQVHTSADASLVQAENLRMAQDRILELEAEIDKLRLDSDEVASAGEVIKQKYEELSQRHGQLEREREELRESYQAEITLLKSKGDFKDQELAKARMKIDELEARIKQDFRKIRFRERELENRIELIKAEQSALLRSKDDYILDLKRKVDHLEAEIENYRTKILETNKLLDGQQEQFKKALRALRLAFTSLEGHLENSQKDGQIVPIKKAE